MTNKKTSKSIQFLKRYSVLIIVFILILLATLFYEIRSFKEKGDIAEPKSAEQIIKPLPEMVKPLPSKPKSFNPTLISIELVRGVLEGGISLATLKQALQENSSPWASDLLVKLHPLKDIKSLPELEELLMSEKRHSKWSLLKKLKNLVHIQRLDKQKVLQALQANKLQKALEAFEKLPPKEQTRLESWKGFVKDRAILEAYYEHLLIQLAGEKGK